MSKTTLDIKGMHCRSCEILLEKNIGKIPHVKKVAASHKKAKIEVFYEDRPSFEQIERVINNAGYEIGVDDKKHFFSRNLIDYLEVGASASVLLAVYAILKTFGLFNLSTSVGSAPSLFGVLLIGLTAGVSTCMALVGGLVLGISARHAELMPEATPLQKFRPHLFFNIGRLVSFVLLGGLIGLAGSALKFSSPVLGVITIGLGLVMLVLGMKLINLFPRLENTSIVLPKGISKLFGIDKEVHEYSHKSAFLTGALTFFIPCGFTQAVQLVAVSSGSFVSGALIMGMFALGTLPGILGIGSLTSWIKGAFARYFFRFAGLVVIFLSVFNISNGWNLTGFSLPIPELSSGIGNSEPLEVKLVGGKQVIEMDQVGGGYEPNEFTVKKGIPVVWKVNSTTSFTCAAYINMPSANISQSLRPGINEFEFTPTKVGKMRFTCSMGMFSGVFNVVE